jgi:hypothetical protein
VIEKVTAVVLTDTVGWKEYALPAVTLVAGVPAMVNPVAGGGVVLGGGGVIGGFGVPLGFEVAGALLVT